MKISADKQYTCGGAPVEHLHRAPEGWPSRYPWRGIADGVTRSWTDEGLHDIDDGANPQRDLIEVRDPLEVMVVVNCHGKPDSVSCASIDGWDSAFPQNAPHTLRKFREVME